MEVRTVGPATAKERSPNLEVLESGTSCKGKGKGSVWLLMEIHLTVMECHLPYGITHFYLSSNKGEHTPP